MCIIACPFPPALPLAWLAMYYQPVQPHPQSVGLFTSLENHQVPIHDPASLAKFMYAGHTPIDHIDPE